MFKPDLRVLSPSGFLMRIGATGELPPPAEAGGKEPAADLEGVGPRPAGTRTLDGFSGSREWQAAVERLAGGQAQQGAEESGLARPAAVAPRSATRAPARFKPETGDDDVPEYRGGKADGQLPDDLARKVGGGIPKRGAAWKPWWHEALQTGPTAKASPFWTTWLLSWPCPRGRTIRTLWRSFGPWWRVCSRHTASSRAREPSAARQQPFRGSWRALPPGNMSASYAA